MRKFRRTIIELLVVVVGGFLIGLTANAMNPEGIAIGRDHFKAARSPQPDTLTTETPEAGPASPAPATATPAATAAPTTSAATDPLDDSLFQILTHDDVVALYQSDAYQDRRIIFIDARDDNHFLEGHIPGAIQLDHYRVDRYIDNVLPYCTNAEQIVAYCHGGSCDDSKLAVLDLIEYGIDPMKLYVYSGGLEAWREAGLPLEIGESNSGDLE